MNQVSEKAGNLPIGVSDKRVRIGFMTYMTATSCQDKPHHNALLQAEKE